MTLKTSLIILVFLLIKQLESNAQKEKNYPANVKLIKKSTAKLTETLYASKAEVTNREYLYFINYLKHNKETEKLKIAQVDSNQWLGNFYNKPYVNHYHTQDGFGVYPLVNISYGGAKLYCQWLTKQYNANPKRKFDKVIFRLPTEKEWILAAKSGNEKAIYPWEGATLKTKNGSYRANFRNKNEMDTNYVNQNTNTPSVTAPVYSYWPNKNGIYNMSGNVAEMIEEKGASKGGSFLNYAASVTIVAKGSYDENSTGQVDLGFRWFMEIIEE